MENPLHLKKVRT